MDWRRLRAGVRTTQEPKRKRTNFGNGRTVTREENTKEKEQGSSTGHSERGKGWDNARKGGAAEAV